MINNFVFNVPACFIKFRFGLFDYQFELRFSNYGLPILIKIDHQK